MGEAEVGHEAPGGGMGLQRWDTGGWGEAWGYWEWGGKRGIRGLVWGMGGAGGGVGGPGWGIGVSGCCMGELGWGMGAEQGQ